MRPFSKQAKKTRNLWPPLLLLLIFTPLYLNTMLPGLGYTGDTAKFQFIGKVMGVPHATGYPLYILLNKLFIQIPLGSIAFRANLMSVFFALAALLMLYYTARKTSGSTPAAFFSAAALGVGFTFWEQALVAEVYSLNAFLLITCLYLMVLWQENRQPRFLYLFFFVYAISFGNHLTMITIFPALLFFIFLVDRAILFKFKTLFMALTAVLLGAGQYLLLILRTWQEAPYLEHRVYNLLDLFHLASGRQFQSSMFVFSPGELLLERLPMIGRAFVADLSWPLLLLGLIGGFSLYKKNRKILALLCLAIGGQLFYAANYDIPDIQVYFIPAFLLFSLFTASGLAKLENRAFNSTALIASFYVILFVQLFNTGAKNINSVDMSNINDHQKWQSLCGFLPEGSLLVTNNYLDYQFLKYMALVEFPEKGFRHLAVKEDDYLVPIILSEIKNEINKKELDSTLSSNSMRNHYKDHVYFISNIDGLPFNKKGLTVTAFSNDDLNDDFKNYLRRVQIEIDDKTRLAGICLKLPPGAIAVSDNTRDALLLEYLFLIDFPEKRLRMLNIDNEDAESDLVLSLLSEIIRILKENDYYRKKYLSQLDFENDPNVNFKIIHLLQNNSELQKETWNNLYLVSSTTRQLFQNQGIKTEPFFHENNEKPLLWRVTWN